MSYVYKVVRLSEVKSVRDFVLLDPKATIPELCGLAAALTMGLMSDSIKDDAVCFARVEDHGFDTSSMVISHHYVIWRYVER